MSDDTTRSDTTTTPSADYLAFHAELRGTKKGTSKRSAQTRGKKLYGFPVDRRRKKGTETDERHEGKETSTEGADHYEKVREKEGRTDTHQEIAIFDMHAAAMGDDEGVSSTDDEGESDGGEGEEYRRYDGLATIPLSSSVAPPILPPDGYEREAKSTTAAPPECPPRAASPLIVSKAAHPKGSFPPSSSPMSIEKRSASKEGGQKTSARAVISPPKIPVPPPRPSKPAAPKKKPTTDGNDAGGVDSGADLEKYRRMLKMGIPEGAVRNKMRMEGISDADAEKLLEKAPSSQKEEKGDGDSAVSEKAELAKFTRMLKMGVPTGAVRVRMQAEGMCEDDISNVLGESGAGEGSKKEGSKMEEERADSGTKDAGLSGKPELAKFARMLKMGVPEGAVRVKMEAEGVSEGDISSLLSSSSSTASSTSAPPPPAPYRSAEEIHSDKVLGKFARMLKMGVPAGAVKVKLEAEGVESVTLVEFFSVLSPSSLPMLGLSSASAAVPRAAALPPPSGAGPSAATIAAEKRRKTKKLHWEPLRGELLKESVWAAVEGDGDDDDEAALDDLEEMFASKPAAKVLPKARHGGGGGIGGGVGVVGGVGVEVGGDDVVDGGGGGGGVRPAGIVDSKRGNNVEIGLAQFRSIGGPEEIWDAILKHGLLLSSEEDSGSGSGGGGEGDGAGSVVVMDTRRLEALQDLLPTPGEARSCLEWPEDKLSALSVCEMWFRVSASVPRAGSKVRVALLSRQFPDLLREVVGKLETIRKVADEVRESERLRSFLAMVLRVGNAMNAGTRKGSAGGFRLDGLLKLNATRAIDGKTTLLDFIARRVAASNGAEALALGEELPSLQAARRTLLKETVADGRRLVAAVRAASVERDALGREKHQTHLPYHEYFEQFASGIDVFLETVQPQVDALAQAMDEANAKARSLAVHFAEDPATPPNEICETLGAFLDQLKGASRKIASESL